MDVTIGDVMALNAVYRRMESSTQGLPKGAKELYERVGRAISDQFNWHLNMGTVLELHPDWKLDNRVQDAFNELKAGLNA